MINKSEEVRMQCKAIDALGGRCGEVPKFGSSALQLGDLLERLLTR